MYSIKHNLMMTDIYLKCCFTLLDIWYQNIIRKEFDNERRRIDDERRKKFVQSKEKDVGDSLQPNVYSIHGHSSSRSTTPSSSIYDPTDHSNRRGKIK